MKVDARQIVRARAGLPIPARVIIRIDVVELQGRLTVDLHDSFSASHGVVVHVGVKKSKAPGSERFHFVGVEFIAHPDFEGPGNDRDVFPLRVPMGRDAKPIRHLQANREVTGRGGWVAFEHSELRTRRTTGGAGPQGMVSGVNALVS